MRILRSDVGGDCVLWFTGVVAARDALLTFMVGGEKFDEAKKVLDNMGKNIIHCGPVGTGQVCHCHTKSNVLQNRYSD